MMRLATDSQHRALRAIATWLGHSPQVAANHYLQTRDAHYELITDLVPRKQKTTKATTHTAASSSTGKQAKEENTEITDELVACDTACDAVEPREWAKKTHFFMQIPRGIRYVSATTTQNTTHRQVLRSSRSIWHGASSQLTPSRSFCC